MGAIQLRTQIVDQEDTSLPGAVLQMLSLCQYQGDRDQLSLASRKHGTRIPVGNLQRQVGSMRTRSGGPRFYIVLEGISQDFRKIFVSPAVLVRQFDRTVSFQAGEGGFEERNQVGDVLAAIVVHRFRLAAQRFRPHPDRSPGSRGIPGFQNRISLPDCGQVVPECRKIPGFHVEHSPIHALPALSRCTEDQLTHLRQNHMHRQECRGIRKAPRLGPVHVQLCLARTVPGQSQDAPVLQFRPDEQAALAILDDRRYAPPAKGTATSQQVNRFEHGCLARTVRSMKVIESGIKGEGYRCQDAETRNLQVTDDHGDCCPAFRVPYNSEPARRDNAGRGIVHRRIGMTT